MMTNKEYEARELDRHRRDMARLTSQPHQEKLDAMQDWRNYMADDLLYIRRATENILAGNYGIAPMLIARKAAPNKRMNRAAVIGQLIAALDCSCPGNKARQAWNMLDVDQQESVNATIMEAVNEYLENVEA